jgi:membrane-associated phospholipid phosphatase
MFLRIDGHTVVPCDFHLRKSKYKYSHINEMFDDVISSKPKSVTSLRAVVILLLSVFISAVPFLLFLFVYGINNYIRVLPTADQSQTVYLHNVSSWELAVLPVSVNKLISGKHCLLLDVLSAIPYLAHYSLPIVYPIVLFVLSRRRDSVRQFYLLLGLTMWIHYVIWYILPTAPPWFYETTGNGSSADSVSLTSVPHGRQGAAFGRLDALTGVGFFRAMFNGNPVPFGAFPSGHVTWPTCVMVTMPTQKRWYFGVYVTVVAWATMYSSHHYLSDVIGAVVIVLATCTLVERLGVVTSPAKRNSLLPLPEKQLLGDDYEVTV